MRKILVALSVSSAAATAEDYRPTLPPEAKRYEAATVTQRLAQVRHVAGGPFVRHTDPVRIADMANADWHQSGGMRGVSGFVSEKYKTHDAVSKYAPILVKNQFGNYQPEMGIVRTYPDGAQFDDVLSYNGKVFEHRVRRKENGEWSNSTVYREPANYPPGYAGLKQTCASCHNRAGTGDYGADGLSPGGDTVFSDPLDWTVVPGAAGKAASTAVPVAAGSKVVEQTVMAADGTTFKRQVVVPADYVVGSGVRP